LLEVLDKFTKEDRFEPNFSKGFSAKSSLVSNIIEALLDLISPLLILGLTFLSTQKAFSSYPY